MRKEECVQVNVPKTCTMRVLQTGMHKNHGGVESFILNYAQALKAHGVVFDHIDLQGKGIACEEQILSEGSKIYTLKDYRKHPFSATKRVTEIVREGNYSCVHINMLSAASLVPVIGALMGKAKVFVHSHNSQTLGIHRKVLHAMHAIILRRLPITRLACGKMAGDWMFGKKDYEIIPNAIDTEKFRFCPESRAELRAGLGLEDDTFVLGFVGRISPQKNPLYLTKVLDAVINRGLRNTKLLLVGDGELQEQVRKNAEDLKIADKVIFAGSQSNVNQWYSAMDILLLPSLWEGLPLVAVEAQTAGLPCIFSDKITKETALTELVAFCELTEAADNWADTILNSRKKVLDRCGYADRIAKTNYSIHQSAKRLWSIYGSAVPSKGENVQ